jgi:hypothetical protein
VEPHSESDYGGAMVLGGPRAGIQQPQLRSVQ